MEKRRLEGETEAVLHRYFQEQVGRIIKRIETRIPKDRKAYEDIVARLENHPSAAAYFCGHNHAGAYAAKNGIHYLTFQGMVETGDTNAGAVVTLTRERIEIDGFGREPDRILELSPREKSPDEK